MGIRVNLHVIIQSWQTKTVTKVQVISIVLFRKRKRRNKKDKFCQCCHIPFHKVPNQSRTRSVLAPKTKGKVYIRRAISQQTAHNTHQ